MKKILLSLAVSLVALVSMAQNGAGNNSIKPMVGMTLSSLFGQNSNNVDSRIGFAAGAEFEHQFNRVFALSAGIMYQQQGTKVKDEEQNKYNTRLDYVNVPILANFYVWKGLSVKAGLQPGFMVHSSLTRPDDYAEFDEKDCNKFDLQVVGGIGYEIKHFVVEFRASYGCFHPFTIGGRYGDFSKTCNLSESLSIGYKFSL